MIILNHKDIPSIHLINVDNIYDIKKTEPNSVIMFDYKIDLVKHCYYNDIPYAVKINSIKEAIFANNLNAKYIISEQPLAIKLQPIVQNYLFDSKNIAQIESEDQIELLALKEIDGVIL